MVPTETNHPDSADAAAVLERIAARDRALARTEALQLEDLARYAAAYPPEPGDDAGAGYSAWAPMELAALLQISEHVARARLDQAIALTTRLPQTLTALKAGEITGYQARRVCEATEVLSDTNAGMVDTRIIDGIGDGLAPAKLNARLRRYVLQADPHAAETRRQLCRQRRRVVHTPMEDAEGELVITGPIERTLLATKRISAIAKHLQAQGAADGRTYDQLRADVALDLLAGKDFEHAKVQVWVTIPAATALGVADLPGTLAGYQDITAQHALELAAQHDATWWRILTDPATGRVVDVGRSRYRTPTALSDTVKVRVPTCTAPGCTRPAVECDIDHLTPFPVGPTSEHNLGPACRHHHQAKTVGDWDTTRSENGDYVWTSPHGLEFTHKPEPIAEPEPRPQPVADDVPPF